MAASPAETLRPDHAQVVTLVVILAYVVAIAIAWNVPFLKAALYPFKVLTVAFHEFGHAFTGILTGAKIRSIELNPDLGGRTTMQGGLLCCTLPAGYLGSSLIGGLLVFFGFNMLASKVAAGFIAALLLLVLFWSRNCFSVVMTLLFVAAIIGVYFIPDPIGGDIMRYFVLFIGVMSAFYSVWDIMEDLILRKENESDASKFAEECRCCPAQGWGIVWGLVSLAILSGFILLALAVWK